MGKIKQKRNIIYSFDYDGCLNHEFSYEEIIPLVTQSGNQALIEAINSEMEQYDEKIGLIGSNRQSFRIDFLNHKRNHTCMAYQELPNFCDALGIKFNKFTMADVYNEIPSGSSLNAALSLISSSTDKELVNCYQNKSEPGWLPDPSKISMLYTQIHKLAAEFSNDHNTFVFYDDRKDILDGIYEFFHKFPQLIPKNIKLELRQHDPLNLQKRFTTKAIKGAGAINFFHEQFIKEFIESKLDEDHIITAKQCKYNISEDFVILPQDHKAFVKKHSEYCKKGRVPVALIDVDHTLIFDKDGEDIYNDVLLNALKTKGIKDIYLFTDMPLTELGIEERLKLIDYLKKAGFCVHKVLTPNDTVWNNPLLDDCDDILSRFQGYIFTRDNSQLTEEFIEFLNSQPNLQQLLELENLTDVQPGGSFAEAALEYDSHTSLSKNTRQKSNNAKLINDIIGLQAGYEDGKGIILDAFITHKPAWVSEIFVFDDKTKVCNSCKVERKFSELTCPLNVFQVPNIGWNNVDLYKNWLAPQIKVPNQLHNSSFCLNLAIAAATLALLILGALITAFGIMLLINPILPITLFIASIGVPVALVAWTAVAVGVEVAIAAPVFYGLCHVVDFFAPRIRSLVTIPDQQNNSL